MNGGDAAFFLVTLAIGYVANVFIGGFLGYAMKDRLAEGILLAVLLGPIGWIIIVLTPAALKSCPHCAAPIPAGTHICQDCRQRFDEARQQLVLQKAAAMRTKADQSKKREPRPATQDILGKLCCPECNRPASVRLELGTQTLFCENCQHQLTS